jgi:hypothetical protein
MSTKSRSMGTNADNLVRRYGWLLVALIMMTLFAAMLFPEGALGLGRRPGLHAENPAVCFEPDYVEIDMGVTQTVSLMVYDIVDFRSIELLLRFDPAKIQIQDADPGQAGIQVGVGDVLAPTQTYTDGYLLQTVDNVAGTISVHAAFAFEDSSFSGSGSLIVITFLGIDGGSSPWTFDTLWLSDSAGASINVDVCQSSVVVLDGTHTPEPTPTHTATATATPTQTPVPTTAIAIVPPHSEVDAGTSTVVQVVVSDVVNFYGVAFELSFDPTLVQVVDADPGEPGVQITLGDFLSPDVVPGHVVDNAAGTIEIAFSQIAPSPPRTGSGAIASIEFVGADVGLSPLVFGDVDLGDSDGLPIPAVRLDGELLVVDPLQPTLTPTATPTAEPTPEEGATLVGSVSFQARPTPPHIDWVSPLSVTLELSSGGGANATYSPTTDAMGVFTITNIVPGVYDIAVRDRNSLWNVRNDYALAMGINYVDMGTVVAGDANNDEEIELLDFSILASTFATSSTDPGWDPRADFNNSGAIDILDYSLLASNFGRLGRTILGP